MSELISSYERWVKATENLNIRRGEVKLEQDNVHCENPISDYRSHLDKCGYGKSVLDVGCGTMYLKRQLSKDVEYIGIDAFPIYGTNAIELAIEEDEVTNLSADTVCAFAILDNCRDFFKAVQNMKAIAKKNIIILTGIGIDPDKYHTLRLEMEHFDKAFSDWNQTHKEKIAPKVYLLSYERPESYRYNTVL